MGLLDDELRFAHYFQSSSKIELISSNLQSRGAGDTSEVRTTWAGKGYGAGNPPTCSVPSTGEASKLLRYGRGLVYLLTYPTGFLCG